MKPGPNGAAGARGSAARLRALVRKEFRQLLRDASNLAIGIALPIVLILVFGYGLREAGFGVLRLPGGRRGEAGPQPVRRQALGRHGRLAGDGVDRELLRVEQKLGHTTSK